MKGLSKFFLAALLLLETTVSWAVCTEWNNQGECIQITVKGTFVQSSDSTTQTAHEFNLIGAFENSDEYFVGNIFFDWSSAEISVDKAVAVIRYAVIQPNIYIGHNL